MSKPSDPRVFFAAERTLLAWNRTNLALIAFGFLIERSGLLLMVLMADRVSTFSLLATLWTGLGFISLGVVGAIYSSKQYASVLRSLAPTDIPKGYNGTWCIVVNGVVALFGFILVIALFLGR